MNICPLPCRLFKVRDLKNRMQSLYNGLTSTTSILGIAGKLPGVGPAVRILKIVINRTKPGLRRGLDRVKAIDAKIYPWKSRADNGVRACDQGNGQFHSSYVVRQR